MTISWTACFYSACGLPQFSVPLILRPQVRRHKTQIPEGAQLEGIPQTVERLALAVDFACIVLREQGVDSEVVLKNRLGKALPAFPLGCGEKAGRPGVLLSSNDPILLANPEISLCCTIERSLVDSTKINNKTCMAGVYVHSDICCEAYFLKI